MNKKIIFTSGGTGGHIFPAINLMKHLMHRGCEVILVTDKKTLKNYFDNILLKNYPKLKIHIINTDTINKKKFIKNIFSILKILISICKSLIILKKEKPNIIIGFGGYVSFPIAFASRFFNSTLMLYESNLILGRANKYLLSIANKLIISNAPPVNLPKKYKKKIYRVGSILDKNIINYLPKTKSKKKYFCILILGGSQGAEIFGKVIPMAMKMLKEKGHNIKIIQQCLKYQKKEIINFYKKNKIKSDIFTFNKNILSLISKADLAISRSGATTIAELTQTCTPFIAVPYPYAMDNHQYLNAKYYKNKKYCWILKEDNFNPFSVFNLLTQIVKNKKNLKIIRGKMKNNNNNSVYKNIEKII